MGIALNLSPAFPDDPENEKSRAAADWYDLLHNRLFLEALFKKTYPQHFLRECKFLPQIQPGDLECIGVPLDFLGINYYTRGIVTPDQAEPLFQSRLISAAPNVYSDMWEFYPEGLLLLLEHIQEHYHPNAIMILENGTSLPERQNDKMRIRYLEAHIQKVREALQKKIPVTGFFVWSLLDNFEWNAGYTKRFGLLDVDFQTQTRRFRESAHWYAKFIKENS